MRRIIVVAVVVALAAVSAAWAVSGLLSGPSIAEKATRGIGGGATIPVNLPPAW
jgi:VIT1/CCC1 family predicted Fe2+/Mn2+ transporter